MFFTLFEKGRFEYLMRDLGQGHVFIYLPMPVELKWP